jgi:hypothetical protein
MANKFKINDVVKITQSSQFRGQNYYNGRITAVNGSDNNEGFFNYTVKFDDGQYNAYSVEDLEYAEICIDDFNLKCLQVA